MNLKKTIFIVPNLLTAASLCCGVFAILQCAASEVVGDDIYNSALLLFYAFLFDLFDGRVARLTRTQSAFGVEFDSLADLVSFGVAPAVIAWRWSLESAGVVGTVVASLYVLGGAIRLARFNVAAHSVVKKSKPGKYMLGLPIPMAAAFIVAFIVAARAMEDGEWPWLTFHGFTVNGVACPMLAPFMLVLAVLMVSTVKFRSFKDFKFKTPFAAFVMSCTLLVSAVLWIWYSPAYILIGLLLMYVTMGFIEGIYLLITGQSRAEPVPSTPSVPPPPAD